MANPDGAMRHPAGFHTRALLLTIAACSLSACNRAPDLPQQSPNRLESRIQRLVNAGMRNALFSYSGRPEALYHVEQPVPVVHPALST